MLDILLTSSTSLTSWVLLLTASTIAAGALVTAIVRRRARATRHALPLLNPLLAVEVLEGAARRAWLLSVVLDLSLDAQTSDVVERRVRALTREVRTQLLRQHDDALHAEHLERLVKRALAALDEDTLDTNRLDALQREL